MTTPVEDPESLAGKLEWIHKYFPEWMHRQYLMGPQKHLLAGPGSLLIDDSEENVEKFRQHDGQAILVPRPWNSLNRANTMKHIIWNLDTIFHREHPC